jgi:hypothetical protein
MPISKGLEFSSEIYIFHFSMKLNTNELFSFSPPPPLPPPQGERVREGVMSLYLLGSD